MNKLLKIYSNYLLDFFFPKYCYCCGRVGKYLCRCCFNTKLKVIPVQKCHVCSVVARLGLMHTDCMTRSYLDGLVYVCRYDDLAKKLIREGKYTCVYDIFSELSFIMFDYINVYKFFRDCYFTSIPLYKSKEKRRGFNQSELLAKSLATLLERPYYRLLTRIRNTKTQVGMKETERGENLKNAFVFSSSERLDCKNVLIVDDVYTTGSTMNEAAKVLKANKIEKVYAFTFAKARS